MPHDVVMDSKGNVWYSDFGQMFLGKMDPKTGKVTQYPIPITKPGFPLGSLDLEIDREDNVWLGMMYQASIVRFDQKTETFKVWSIPKEWDSEGAQFGHLAVNGTHVDGKVWVKNSDGTKIYRLDLASDQWEDLGAPNDPRTNRRIGTYGIHADTATNDAYLLDFAAGNIVKIDAKTKATTVYLTPSPNSTPRRGPRRRRRPRVVRRIPGRPRRDARSEDGADHRVEGADRPGARLMMRCSAAMGTPGPAPC